MNYSTTANLTAGHLDELLFWESMKVTWLQPYWVRKTHEGHQLRAKLQESYRQCKVTKSFSFIMISKSNCKVNCNHFDGWSVTIAEIVFGETQCVDLCGFGPNTRTVSVILFFRRWTQVCWQSNWIECLTTHWGIKQMTHSLHRTSLWKSTEVALSCREVISQNQGAWCIFVWVAQFLEAVVDWLFESLYTWLT